jgi:hypothetical protein
MKRNWDVFRQLLRLVAVDPEVFLCLNQEFGCPMYGHARLLADAGLIEIETFDDSALHFIEIRSITERGYWFLELSSNEAAWARAMAIAKERDGLDSETLISILNKGRVQDGDDRWRNWPGIQPVLNREMRNAKMELRRLIEAAASPLICASVCLNDEMSMVSQFDLPMGYGAGEFATFMNRLDFQYEALTGFPTTISGVLWFESTWAARVRRTETITLTANRAVQDQSIWAARTLKTTGLGEREFWQFGGIHKSPIDHRPPIYERLIRGSAATQPSN